jgi:3-methyladenine DNA glycosylase AlkD
MYQKTPAFYRDLKTAVCEDSRHHKKSAELEAVANSTMHPLQLSLRKKARSEKISIYQNFFKTGKGEYGEGDIFIGVTVPDTREVAQHFVSIPLPELIPILSSKIHEDRMCGLLVLVYKFQSSHSEKDKKEVVDFYIKHHLAGNNWDLIDCVADKILGPWLMDKDKALLYKYANSDNLWERRIAIVSTFHFIKNNSFDDTLKISEILLKDKHDLIHKACGWMLREVGKRNKSVLVAFLKKHYHSMPRTMLRYAIERFPERERKAYLNGTV